MYTRERERDSSVIQPYSEYMYIVLEICTTRLRAYAIYILRNADDDEIEIYIYFIVRIQSKLFYRTALLLCILYSRESDEQSANWIANWIYYIAIYERRIISLYIAHSIILRVYTVGGLYLREQNRIILVLSRASERIFQLIIILTSYYFLSLMTSRAFQEQTKKM